MPTVIVFLETVNQPLYRICSRNRGVGATSPGEDLSLKVSNLTHRCGESLLVKRLNISVTGSLNLHASMERGARAQLEGN